MKKMILCTGALLLAASLHAELVLNPDANTLWKDNFKPVQDAKVKAPVWRANKNIKITSADAGLVLEGSGDTGAYYKLSSDYPWLCLTFDQASKTANGYHAFSFRPAKDGLLYFGTVSKILKGTYIYNIGSGKGIAAKPNDCFIRLDIFNANVRIKELTEVKVPPCKITVTPATEVKLGDDVTFTVETAKKAESAELVIHQTYTMPTLSCDGKKRFILKEVAGSNGTKWSATLKYNGFTGCHGKDKVFKPGQLLFQMTVETPDAAENYFMVNDVPFQRSK